MNLISTVTSLVLGVDVYAIAIVISGFFMGLGVGSYYFSRRAQDHLHPVLLYRRLEIATAVCAVLAVVAATWRRVICRVGASLRLSVEPKLR